MLSIQIAFRYFFAKKKEKLISIISSFALIGMILGVATLIVTLAIQRGFYVEFVESIISVNSDIRLDPITSRISEAQYSEMLERIQSKTFVRHVIPTTFAQTVIISKTSKHGCMVIGISDKDLEIKQQITKQLIIHSDLALEENGIILGHQLANNLGVAIGDSIQLMSTESTASMFGNIPRTKTLRVIGMLRCDVPEYSANAALVDIGFARKFFNININTLEIYTDDITQSTKYKAILQDYTKDIYSVSSWEDFNAPTLHALDIERIMMATILTLIILLAAFNVLSSVSILVKNKSKDIAILQTIGLSQIKIMSIFLINGFIIGILGTGIGTLTGLLVASNIQPLRHLLERITGVTIFDSAVYFFAHLPVSIMVSDVIYVAAFSLFLPLLAALYPAYKASRLSPIEIMRNQ